MLQLYQVGTVGNVYSPPMEQVVVHHVCAARGSGEGYFDYSLHDHGLFGAFVSLADFVDSGTVAPSPCHGSRDELASRLWFQNSGLWILGQYGSVVPYPLNTRTVAPLAQPRAE
jgi:hypothetical protein